MDASDFASPALYAHWAADPLMVSCSGNKFGKCLMSGALLSNDRVSRQWCGGLGGGRARGGAVLLERAGGGGR